MTHIIHTSLTAGGAGAVRDWEVVARRKPRRVRKRGEKTSQ
jgi:hypothetical protein